MSKMQRNIPLKDFSNYKIGGPASFFLEVKSVEDLKQGLSEFYGMFPNGESRPEVFILGSGTNVLIDDKGFSGLVLRNLISHLKLIDGVNVEAGSGTSFKDLVDFCIENSLSGLEWAGGLPGTVGGATRGNAGAFKGETKDSIKSVESVDLKTLEKKTRAAGECNFGYRTSIFKKGEGEREMIVSAVFEFKRGDREEIRSATYEKTSYRNKKHPLDYPNIGSTFKNIPFDTIPDQFREEFKAYIKDDPFPIVPVAKLLALSGLKGREAGGAQISEKHPNFIVNKGSASSNDVRSLIQTAKDVIKKNYLIDLEEEIYYLPPAMQV